MNKKLLVSLFSVLVLSTNIVMADDTTTTTTKNTRPEPPRFENLTEMNRQDFNSNGGNFAKGQPPQFNGEKGQNVQFNGRRPKYKPDSQPGGKIEPKEWGTNNQQNEQGLKGGQPPQFNGENFNGRPPMPPKDTTTSTSES